GPLYQMPYIPQLFILQPVIRGEPRFIVNPMPFVSLTVQFFKVGCPPVISIPALKSGLGAGVKLLIMQFDKEALPLSSTVEVGESLVFFIVRFEIMELPLATIVGDLLFVVIIQVRVFSPVIEIFLATVIFSI